MKSWRFSFRFIHFKNLRPKLSTHFYCFSRVDFHRSCKAKEEALQASAIQQLLRHSALELKQETN